MMNPFLLGSNKFVMNLIVQYYMRLIVLYLIIFLPDYYIEPQLAIHLEIQCIIEFAVG
jgi:hypothetical protein